MATIEGSRSMPTTSTPRRASSAATRPVPHPASSTVRGARRDDAVGLAVDVDPGRGELVEAPLVGPAVPLGGAGRPARRVAVPRGQRSPPGSWADRHPEATAAGRAPIDRRLPARPAAPGDGESAGGEVGAHRLADHHARRQRPAGHAGERQ